MKLLNTTVENGTLGWKNTTKNAKDKKRPNPEAEKNKKKEKPKERKDVREEEQKKEKGGMGENSPRRGVKQEEKNISQKNDSIIWNIMYGSGQ